ncbi:hypothetical protein UFOVP1219_73 [uncultured Caudovirales phage]|uniref:Uncharacterized protein n=1 Tax=uncultured Caudovirales phage TaxID=2100421 RepID=A0A6J5T8D1_9CAUD|nr:hypothetical protein UFOVP476_45 [uncultured Caudovirales phage]CAB4176401.1 hypothetical protein UFOVP986_30 [uncultured Caudovirales phage]CAB4191600.1 hypothetical protein UFOVP1219_73 [uncultured Caudovirales phage]CAB4223341.1 hypothetical protein UFOVP1671_48 [uncultured Caudovirales phage]CAB5220544.1 hypothetical protein UFOVP358_59 [uncultured Caudovirales phage]
MKLIKELHAQIWTVAGVILVLITLSGETLSKATVIFGVSLALHFIGVLFTNDDKPNEP